MSASAFTPRSPPRGAAGRRCRRSRRSAPGRSAPSRCPRTAAGRPGSACRVASPMASRGMSTPAAIVSGIVPGKRALTSSSAGSPAASTLTWTLATVVRPISPATSRAKRSSASSCSVRPVTAIPESTFSRSRGTTAATCPSARASTSSEYSGPGRCSWTSSVPSRSSASSSSTRSISRIPREPLPSRGLTITGSATAAGSKASSATTVLGTRTYPSQRSTSAHLSMHVSSVSTEARTSVTPASAKSARRRASGSSSLSTVGTTTSTASRRQRASRSSAKRGSSPRRRIERWPASTM